MDRIKWMMGLFVLSLCLLPTGAGAQQEHGGATTAAPASQEHGGKEHAGTGAATPAAAPAPAEQAPEPASQQAPLPPALKPITITFGGELTAANTEASPATITVQDRYGVKKEITVSPEVKVTQGASGKALSDLKVGDKLTVEYTYDVATGKRTAQAISIGESTAAAR